MKSKTKKTIAILLVSCFLVSATVMSASACTLRSNLFKSDWTMQQICAGNRLMQNGDNYQSVKLVQSALIRLGYPLPKYGADGIFGDETEAAVKNYQSGHSYVLETDGIVGPKTLNELDYDIYLLETGPSPNPSPSSTIGDEKRKGVVDFAKQFEGKIPYWMDTEITTQTLDLNHLPPHMDCADFTSSVYLTKFNINIGPNTYTQINKGTSVPKDKSDLKLGDLIFFDWGGDGVSDHVAMYIGNGKYINEGGTNSNGGNVREGNVKDVWTNIISIRRIIQDDGSLKV